MAREIKVQIWCDPCQEIDDTQVEAEELPQIIIGNMRPKILAMCKDHRESFFEPFLEAVNSMGAFAEELADGASQVRASARRPGVAKMAQTPSTGERVMCPVQGCGQDLKNIASTQAHLRQSHDSNLFNELGKEGQLFDVNGAPVDMPEIRAPRQPSVLETKCEICGDEFKYPEYTMPAQAVGLHKSRKHGVKPERKSRAKTAKAAK